MRAHGVEATGVVGARGASWRGSHTMRVSRRTAEHAREREKSGGRGEEAYHRGCDWRAGPIRAESAQRVRGARRWAKRAAAGELAVRAGIQVVPRRLGNALPFI